MDFSTKHPIWVMLILLISIHVSIVEVGDLTKLRYCVIYCVVLFCLYFPNFT